MKTYLQSCKHGNFVLLQSDFISDCMSLYGEWAEREVALFLGLLASGSQVIEVGSNIGTHSVPIAKKIGPSGKLICIEAQRIIFQILSANVVINNLTNVRTMCGAVADKSGSIFLKETDFESAANGGAYSVVANAVQESGERTAVFTIDNVVEVFQIEKLDLLKIDVEGMEGAVLHGAEKTLQTLQPSIFFECNSWQNPLTHEQGDALHAWLASFGYRLYWYCCLGFNPENFKKIKENRIGSFGDINVLALPAGEEPPFALPVVQSVTEVFKNEMAWVELPRPV